MKIGQSAWLAGLASAALSAIACSSSSSNGPSTSSSTPSDSGAGGAASGTAPTISITAPTDGMAVSPANAPAFPDVEVKLDIANFTLKDPGRTDGSGCPKGTCGHVHLLVDDGDGDFTRCNDTNTPYNAAGVALTGNTIGLDYCPKIDGAHSIKGELHNDDHSPVLGSDGKVITSNVVKITVTGGADGG